jgi:UDP-N-acetylmuramoyl-tripeptide--D-alanyl-D-alanine ligase
MFKNHVRKRLEKGIKKYFAKHSPKLVVVVGSAGKTTTKTAIATVLAGRFRVQMEETNHNTDMSVPLAILGIRYPDADEVHSVKAWRHVLKAVRQRVKQPTGVDVIVQELGTDHPGEIPHFGEYLRPDIAVVTSVMPEHMEFFGTMDAVAREELAVASYSGLTVINRDDVDSKFAPYASTTNITDYGLNGGEYRFEMTDGAPLTGYRGNLLTPEFGSTPVEVHLVGDHNVKAAVAAATVAAKLGLSAEEIAAGLAKILPVKGRMNILRGVRDTTIIDDTYNSSPKAAEEALRTLYQIDTPQRIAILGSMNELGDFTAAAHQELGNMCDPNLLDWVITIGEAAARYLAPAARARGCQVEISRTPYEAGAFANKVIHPGAVILAKGSQNGVFAEEAVKVLLHSVEEEDVLVRQSPDWMAVIDSQFETPFDIGRDKD